MKLDDVKPLDIDSLLGKSKNRVELVGVELEGAWAQLPPGVQALEHDGSVFNGRLPPRANYVGELPIPATTPAGISELIKINYPSVVNETCGMHVHMSFSNLWHYRALMVPEYPATVIEYLKRWAKAKEFKDTHHIWERLNGSNKYCKHEFYADLQARSRSKSHAMNVPGQRYTTVHYCGRLKTIECRVLPMMTKKSVAVEAVQEVIKITNACLYKLAPDVRKTSGKDKVKIELPDHVIYEENVVKVF